MERIVEAAIEAAGALTQALAGVDPGSLPGSQAVELVETLARVEKVCAAVRARVVARAEDWGAYHARGHHSAAQWLAKTLGTSQGQATATIETAKAIEGLAATREAFAAGRISEAQAAEVAKAAAADPTAEAGLLQTAEHGDWRSLKAQARRVRLNAEVDREALHERQHRAREFTHWVDDEGMIAGRFRLPPEVGAPLVNRIDTHTDRHYRRGWQQGGREPRAAYAADALVELLSGPGSGGPSRADVAVVVDLDALRRGHTHDGERSHIPGVGPLPVAVARRIAENAFLKAVVIDGGEIRKVKHFGRHIPAELRTALQLGKAPELDGATCVEERVADAATGWSGITWILSPTADPPPTATSRPAAVPTTVRKRSEIGKQV